MFNAHREKKENCQKSKNWNFTILYTTLVNTLPVSMPGFLGRKSVVYFQIRCRLVFSPIWSHVNEKKGKYQNFKFPQIYTTLAEKYAWFFGGETVTYLRRHRGVMEKTIYFVKFWVTSRYFGKISRYFILLLYIVTHLVILRKISCYFAKNILLIREIYI